MLALLAEGDAHGYDLMTQAWNRGFRYWTDTKRSAIYKALQRLQQEGLITSRKEAGQGPTRKVYSITDAGRRRLAADAAGHLACPDHPRNELDLGVYAFPFVPRDTLLDALARGLEVLAGRNAFLEERMAWCDQHGLPLPRLAFERAYLASQANEEWLRRVRQAILDGELDPTAPQWGEYEYRQPPEPRVPDDAPP